MLRVAVSRHPTAAVNELNSNVVIAANERTVSNLTCIPRLPQPDGYIGIHRELRVCLNARASYRNVLKYRSRPVRPTQTVAPEKLDYVRAEIAPMGSPFDHMPIYRLKSAGSLGHPVGKNGIEFYDNQGTDESSVRRALDTPPHRSTLGRRLRQEENGCSRTARSKALAPYSRTQIGGF
jgi:hypothetical protein